MSTVPLSDEENVLKRTAAAAAAAAARKRRRKALAKRRSMSPQKSRPTAGIPMIPPTLSGVQEVARRWCAGEAVVIPTECTYEVGIRLSMILGSGEPLLLSPSPSPPPSLEARDAAAATDSLPSNLPFRVQDLLRSQEKHERCPTAASSTPHLYVSGLHKSSAATAFLRHNLPERKYAYRRDGKVVSLHAFSESIQVLKRLSAKLWPGPVMLYVAVGGRRITSIGGGSSSASLSSAASCCSGLASPSRASSVTTTASVGSPLLAPMATTHEESMSSLPSPPPSPPATPVLIAGHGHASTPAFLALRCPCHPLAVRVSHEFYQTSSDLLVGCALRHRHIVSHHKRGDADSDDDDEDKEEQRAVDDNNSLRIHNEDADKAESSEDAYVIRAGDVCHSSRRDGSGSASTVHTSVGTVGAVLHGEQPLELFHVPPCEYRQPYGVSLWIDEGSRRIVIRGTHAATGTVEDNAIVAATATPAASAAGHHHHHRPQVSVSSVRQALLFKPKNERDRVVHAVLNKWAVDEEP